ncbi:MAG: GTP-binding protein [Chloroflexota bacterium]
MPAVQINTGGQCHLDAVMLGKALPTMPTEDVELLIVENVGNLICPASFKLGTTLMWWLPVCRKGTTNRISTPTSIAGLMP